MDRRRRPGIHRECSHERAGATDVEAVQVVTEPNSGNGRVEMKDAGLELEPLVQWKVPSVSKGAERTSHTLIVRRREIYRLKHSAVLAAIGDQKSNRQNGHDAGRSDSENSANHCRESVDVTQEKCNQRNCNLKNLQENVNHCRDFRWEWDNDKQSDKA
jgi:hypothetical protein